MWSCSAFLVLIAASATLASDVLWVDDPAQENAFNCDGFVTDAICCLDRLCNGQSEASCTSDPKRSAFCAWHRNSTRCVAVRDSQNNVCCQKKPVSGCQDFMKGRCPEEFQTSEDCCSTDAKKWNGMFKGVAPGKVCCNAPCKEAENKKCNLPSKCSARSIYGPYLNPYDYGFGPYINKKLDYGNYYPSLYSTIDNTDLFSDYETKEVTVDDIINMMVEALEHDEDVVESDKTLHTSPIGKYEVHNAWPYKSNYVDPDFILKRLLSPYGLQGYQGQSYQPYGYQQPSYGYQGQSYGYQQPSYGYQQPSYGYQGQSYGYQQPSYGYQQPSYGYQGPSQGYQGQSQGYQGPSQGYQGPSQGYQQESYGKYPEPEPYGKYQEPEPYGKYQEPSYPKKEYGYQQ